MTGKLSTPTVLKTIIDRKVEEVRERQGMASLSEVMAPRQWGSPDTGLYRIISSVCSIGPAGGHC